jgi:hypothetical protein
MATVEIDEGKLSKAQDLANEFLKELREWIPKRRATMEALRSLADELDQVAKNVDKSKGVGLKTAVAGGVACIAGAALTFFTFGFGAPLAVAGITATLAGSVTNAGAEVVGGLISSGKIDEAQKLMDEDKAAFEQIEKHQENLQIKMEEIVMDIPQLTCQHVLTSLSLESEIHRQARIIGKAAMLPFAARELLNPGTFDVSAINGSGVDTAKIARLVLAMRGAAGLAMSGAKGLAMAGAKGLAGAGAKGLAGAGAKGLAKIGARGVARGVGVVVAPLFLYWDIKELINRTDDSSKSAVAKQLRDIANRYEEHQENIQKFLDELE